MLDLSLHLQFGNNFSSSFALFASVAFQPLIKYSAPNLVIESLETIRDRESV